MDGPVWPSLGTRPVVRGGGFSRVSTCVAIFSHHISDFDAKQTDRQLSIASFDPFFGDKIRYIFRNLWAIIIRGLNFAFQRPAIIQKTRGSCVVKTIFMSANIYYVNGSKEETLLFRSVFDLSNL